MCPDQLGVQDLKVLPAEFPIGFKMISFSPFVPRFDENNSVIARFVGNLLERAPEVLPEQLRG